MKKRIIWGSLFFIGGFGVIFCFFIFDRKFAGDSFTEINNKEEEVSEDLEKYPAENVSRKNEEIQIQSELFVSPMDRAGERVNKKPFGIYITRQNSPIKPERFSGYHTGADFEIFPEELEGVVAVRAVCDGKIIKKDSVSGYGGVLIQSCEIADQIVTVLYGHLNLTSIKKGVGDNLIINEYIGNLGRDRSIETDGERKHLHLGIHKGGGINFLGYVQDENQLSNWLDPCEYFCK
ncbi:MAG: M23 family metallopeptidase [Candidatus Moraniibacteriota bacterium]